MVKKAVVLVHPEANCSKTIEASSLPKPIPPKSVPTYNEQKPRSPAFLIASRGNSSSLSQRAACGFSSLSEKSLARFWKFF